MQNPHDLTDVTCDICGKQIHPMDRFVRWQTQTLYSGAIGTGLFICGACLQKLGVKAEAINVH